MGTLNDPKVDSHTGTATTGHEWDGIAELNTPLPRWWLWTLYLCIVWAIGYWILYPSWPLLTGYTKGLFNWNSRSALEEDLGSLRSLRAPLNAKISAASLADIEKNPELLDFSRAQGAAAFAINCSPCHGSGAQGSPGYPNLNDDDWIWGGTLEQIQYTIMHGVRWDADKETRSGAMPSFGKDGTLKAAEISDVADYVMSLSNMPIEKGADLAKGKAIFADNCAVCHGENGGGSQELGAPNLSDQIWFYGNSKAAIVERINLGGGGVMPAWGVRLDPTTIKTLTVYVHSLGGGK